MNEPLDMARAAGHTIKADEAVAVQRTKVQQVAGYSTTANYNTASKMRRAIRSAYNAAARLYDVLQAIRDSDHHSAEAVYEAMCDEGYGHLADIDAVGCRALDAAIAERKAML